VEKVDRNLIRQTSLDELAVILALSLLHLDGEGRFQIVAPLPCEEALPVKPLVLLKIPISK
jgi:hypothetical protein